MALEILGSETVGGQSPFTPAVLFSVAVSTSIQCCVWCWSSFCCSTQTWRQCTIVQKGKENLIPRVNFCFRRRGRKNLESRSLADDERLTFLETQLKEAKYISEDADHKYDEVIDCMGWVFACGWKRPLSAENETETTVTRRLFQVCSPWLSIVPLSNLCVLTLQPMFSHIVSPSQVSRIRILEVGGIF